MPSMSSHFPFSTHFVRMTLSDAAVDSADDVGTLSIPERRVMSPMQSSVASPLPVERAVSR
jgi:hypothetical protein